MHQDIENIYLCLLKFGYSIRECNPELYKDMKLTFPFIRLGDKLFMLQAPEVRHGISMVYDDNGVEHVIG